MRVAALLLLGALACLADSFPVIDGESLTGARVTLPDAAVIGFTHASERLVDRRPRRRPAPGLIVIKGEKELKSVAGFDRPDDAYVLLRPLPMPPFAELKSKAAELDAKQP